MRRCLFIQVFLQSHNLLITLYYQRLIIPVLILSQQLFGESHIMLFCAATESCPSTRGRDRSTYSTG